MKLTRRPGGRLVVELGRREGNLLLLVLKQYPCLPPAHQPLSKSGLLPNQQDTQQLLDEALAEQRAECKKQLRALLADPQRFKKKTDGYRLSLSPGDAEWLLQVLNDIRVGSWVILGSPEGRVEGLNVENAKNYWAMEMAGAFQAELVAALDDEWDGP
ncbi:MAG TPA: hypothetical protein VMU04_24010 [Candidatus Acidoferrum sp.]|nr:hypothetical protein [Candidatus Acidoferrum sp.]